MMMDSSLDETTVQPPSTGAEGSTERRDRWALAGVALAFFILYTAFASRQFWQYEAGWLPVIHDQASLPYEKGGSPLWLTAGWLLDKIASALSFHDTVALMQLLNAALAAWGLWLFSLLVFQVTRRLGAAIAAAVLVGGSYAYSLHSTHMTQTIAFFPFALLGILLAVRARLGNRIFLASLSGFFMGVAICFAYPALFLIPVTVLAMVLTRLRGHGRRFLLIMSHLFILVFTALFAILFLASAQTPRVPMGEAISTWFAGWGLGADSILRNIPRSAGGFFNAWFNFQGPASPKDMVHDGVTLLTVYRVHILLGCAVLILLAFWFYRRVKAQSGPEQKRWLFLFALWAVLPAVLAVFRKNPWSEALWILPVTGAAGMVCVLYPLVARRYAVVSPAKLWVLRVSAITIVLLCFAVNTATGMISKRYRSSPHLEAAAAIAREVRPHDLVVLTGLDGDPLHTYLNYKYGIRVFLFSRVQKMGIADFEDRFKKEVEAALSGRKGELYFVGLIDMTLRDWVPTRDPAANRRSFALLDPYRGQAKLVVPLPESVTGKKDSGLWKYTPSAGR